MTAHQPGDATEHRLFARAFWIRVAARFVDAKRTWESAADVARADPLNPQRGPAGPKLYHKVLRGSASQRAALDAGLAHAEAWCRIQRSAVLEVLINAVEQFTDYDSGFTPLAPIFPPGQRDHSEVANAKRIFLTSAQDLVQRARNPSTQHTLLGAADALAAKFELALVPLQNEYEYEEFRLYAGAIVRLCQALEDMSVGLRVGRGAR
jgi:hypothetical protein